MLPTRIQYWRARAAWAREQSSLWTLEKLASSLVLGSIGYFLQYWLGVRLMHQTLQIILTLVLAYGFVAILQFLGNCFINAPVVIDRARVQEIAALANENEKLKNPEKLFSLEFKSLHYGPQTGATTVVVHLKLLNHGPAITLHDIRLCSDDDPKLGLSPQHNGFAERNAAVNYVRLEPGDARDGFFQFYIVGQHPDQAWALEFKDTNNKKIYHESIPSQFRIS
jgi:hypothetical protein